MGRTGAESPGTVGWWKRDRIPRIIYAGGRGGPRGTGCPPPQDRHAGPVRGRWPGRGGNSAWPREVLMSTPEPQEADDKSALPPNDAAEAPTVPPDKCNNLRLVR